MKVESLTLRVERGSGQRSTDNSQQTTDELSSLIHFINVMLASNLIRIFWGVRKYL